MLCYCFNFEKSLDVLKWKCRCILLNKNINFNKNKTGSKWKILHTVLERPTLSFSSYTNRKLKLKLWWVGAHERKVRAFLYFFYRLFCPKEFFFFNICVLFQCTVYWIHFQNIHTFTYQKTLFQNRRKPSNVSLMESNTFKGVSFITEVKLKALSWILLIKFFEQNIHKSRQ